MFALRLWRVLLRALEPAQQEAMELTDVLFGQALTKPTQLCTIDAKLNELLELSLRCILAEVSIECEGADELVSEWQGLRDVGAKEDINQESITAKRAGVLFAIGRSVTFVNVLKRQYASDTDAIVKLSHVLRLLSPPFMRCNAELPEQFVSAASVLFFSFSLECSI